MFIYVLSCGTEVLYYNVLTMFSNMDAVLLKTDSEICSKPKEVLFEFVEDNTRVSHTTAHLCAPIYLRILKSIARENHDSIVDELSSQPLWKQYLSFCLKHKIPINRNLDHPGLETITGPWNELFQMVNKRTQAFLSLLKQLRDETIKGKDVKQIYLHVDILQGYVATLGIQKYSEHMLHSQAQAANSATMSYGKQILFLSAFVNWLRDLNETSYDVSALEKDAAKDWEELPISELSKGVLALCT